MSSVPRNRSRSYGPANPPGETTLEYNIGGTTTFFATYPGGSGGRGSETMLDGLTVDGTARSPITLQHMKYAAKCQRINGSYSIGSYRKSIYGFKDHISYGLGANFNKVNMSDGWMNPAAFDNHIIKSLQVNHQEIDIPLFLFELKDFPRMLRQLGRVLKKDISPKDVPGGYLAYQFGWTPLINDVIALFGLADSMKNRFDYLLKISQGEGKRIKRNLYSYDNVATSNPAWFDQIIQAQTETTTKRRVWFTCRIGDVDNTIVDDLLLLHRRARSGNVEASGDLHRRMLGIRADRNKFKTLWDALPWSWLIDYFASIGDFIEAQTAQLPFTPRDVCVMRKTEYEIVFKETGRYLHPSYNYSSGELTDGWYRTTYQERYPRPNLRPRVLFTPILSGRQTSILGALALAGPLKISR